MSHIEEMIRELCPNGVEYKKAEKYNYHNERCARC